MGAVRAGETIGSYRLLRELGAGGMGAVFAAEHSLIERRAAIKILHPELSARPDVAARFVTEARASNRVRHPAFCEVQEIGQLPDGGAYLVMELLEGESLRARLARGPLGAAALPVTAQLAAAMAAAHAAGVVHRDLKPDNVMLVPDVERPGRERVKILDLGIARLVAAEQAEARGPLRTRTGAILGTPAYMAPEQCLGAPGIDGKADVYALGVLLYEMLAGRRPFDASSELELLTCHVSAPPPPLRPADEEVPAEVVVLCEAMLAKDAAARPTMVEVAETLGRPAVAPTISRDPVPASPIPRQAARRALWVWVLAGAFAVGGAAFLTLRLREPAKTHPEPGGPTTVQTSTSTPLSVQAPAAAPAHLPSPGPTAAPAGSASMDGPVASRPSALKPASTTAATGPVSAPASRPAPIRARSVPSHALVNDRPQRPADLQHTAPTVRAAEPINVDELNRSLEIP